MRCRIDEAPDGRSKCAAVYKLNKGISQYARAYLSQFYVIPIKDIVSVSSYDNGYQYSFATTISSSEHTGSPKD
jgi:hypothetical protein